ncbi:DNA-directed RNA polymerase subunit beta' [Patescibacteria group bacterium]|nr:DNA-directed RNA polymerase subunit beta' [Patescibacteria group bacterium]
MKNLVDFKGLLIKLASPEIIKTWSHGEVIKPETINYRTLKPEKDGLFCERIFGPSKDYECYCGKYKHVRYRGIICDKCGVEVTRSRVRRERMGHIDLVSPVAHVWFFKGSPSKLSLLLDIPPRSLAGVIYFAKYLVLKVDARAKEKTIKKLKNKMEEKKQTLKHEFESKIELVKKKLTKELTAIQKKIRNQEQQGLVIEEVKIKAKQQILGFQDNLLSEQETAEQIFKAVIEMIKKIKVRGVIGEEEYLKLVDYQAADFLEVSMGAEAVLKSISKLDLKKLTADLRKIVQTTSGAKQLKAIKRLRVIEGMRKVEIDPAWMVLKILPVLPPDLRPMVQLSGGRFATSDLNDLYRRVINRNNRLKHLVNLGAPEIILRNEKRMLQEAVDALIDSTQAYKIRRRVTKKLRSLSDMLRGKQGRFRQNLLGKRVDYSGRSVIVVGPELKINQCGLPKDMALEMFKPFVLRELIARGIAPNVKSAKNVLENRPAEVFDILEEITVNHPVLLNRAPTLHKLGIQAFYPVLTEGGAIRLHPCVCSGYNADFDGDQMAVHVPLSKKAIEEAINIMMPANNLLKPADGSPIAVPNKEMALGIYYVTVIDLDKTIYPTIFTDELEVKHAYQQKIITLRQPIKVRIKSTANKSAIITTTVGRILLNQLLPKSLRFLNEEVNSGKIKDIVTTALRTRSRQEVVELIDNLKEFGFIGATLSGISVGVFDCQMLEHKNKIITRANRKVAEIEKNFKQGLITNEEKKRLSNQIWLATTEEIADKTWNNFSEKNSVKIIIDSGGTRASKDQVKQLAAMRGLVVDPLGKIVEMPTKSNFREGLSIFEYVTSARGSRKGLTDSAIKTADAGYLTRRLVDVAHDVIIRQEDCGTKEGLIIVRGGERGDSFAKRITGRILAEDIVLPRKRKPIFKRGEVLDKFKVAELIEKKVDQVMVRSPLTCQSRIGLCRACYGWHLANNELVELGVPVGVLAAQSIGEPGTQLTMRVKHFGGIVAADVTQGLPRVEELFEARVPKLAAPLAGIGGKVSIETTESGYKVTVKTVAVKPVEEKTYTIALTSHLRVKNGQLIPVGYQLADGGLDIKEILKIRGLRAVQTYLLNEVQQVYESQGIPIHDKHFEVIIRKMCDKVQVESAGDTILLPGQIVEKARFEEENAKVLAEGGEPAVAKLGILGITRSALYTESWLSAASFIETSKVLTNAASEGKEDYLVGLKENVIIGRLIPTSAERAKIED